jgi:hypothetical protein
LIVGAALLAIAIAPAAAMTIGQTASSTEGQLASSMSDLILKFWRWATESGGLLMTLLATAAGAWAGGAAAFRSERSKREQDRRRDQAAAIDRALFTLFRFHRLIATLMHDFVEEAEKDPVNMLVLKPTLESGWAAPRVDVASLDFLHSTPDQMVLSKLIERDDTFQAVAALVRERSIRVEEWVKPLAEKYPMTLDDGSPGFDANAVAHGLSFRQRADLTLISSEILVAVKREMVELPATQKLLAGVFRAVFPELSPPVYLSVAENESVATPVPGP